MPYITKPLKLLVIEDNEGDFLLFQTYLQQTTLSILAIHHATTLSAVGEEAVDIAFLDLSLPDSGGVESFIQLNQRLPEVPIVVLTGNSDGTTAMECIQLGAQDYLVKDDLNEKLLEKSLHFSIERKKNLEKIRNINRQYELIASITNDVVWYWDLETNEISCRKKEFFGYTEETLGAQLDWWVERIHPEDRVRVLTSFQQVIARNVPAAQEEYRLRAADGGYRHVFNRVRMQPENVSPPNRLMGAMMDITERKKLQADLVSTQLQAQKQIAEASLLAQEKQKEEIGKELHDNINQILASVNLYLDTALHNKGMREELLLKGKEHTLTAINEIRKLSHSLMPPALESHGLKETLAVLAEELALTGLFVLHLSAEEFNEAALDARKKIVLYRIVQEQVNNIIKYAKASEVTIRLHTCGGSVKLTITDNGVGFDPAKKSAGIGLRNIESRVSYYAGEMQLHSTPGAGTELSVRLPL